MMTYEEALRYYAQIDMMGSHLGLDRMAELLRRLGNPEKQLKFVHVAGTNGKGSTAALLDACLRQAGYRVGLYTSPHLVRYNERFQAFCCFLSAGCDIVVLEVGLGGRLDATNSIPVPEAAVITRIGLEHTEILGDTIEKIAAEKGGIIKAGGTVVLGDSSEAVVGVTQEICQERGAALIPARSAVPLSKSLEGQRFSWGPYPEICLSLLGEHQLQNAATALTVLEVLRTKGWQIPDEAILKGMRTAVWPGRFECVSRHPVIIIDGGHNQQCAEAIAVSLRSYFPGKKCSFLMGVLADKDFHGIFDAILPLAARIAAVTPDSHRALPAPELCQRLRDEYGYAAAVPYATMTDALRELQRSAEGEDVICICGSLYMVGEARELFKMT